LYWLSGLAIILVVLMSDPRRVESAVHNDGGTVDRASQADALLVQGLHLYFDGHFEDAIHIWTRVLFLDRSHARARAYIDRARSAVAERQRRSEEMLQASQQLLESGETDAARHLLTEAVASNGDDERASAVRVKLERVERARAGASRLSISAAPAVVPAWAWPVRSLSKRLLMSVALAACVLVVALAGLRTYDWLEFGVERDELAAPPAQAGMQVLSSSDVALIRARTLFGRGRLAQALQALDRVDDRSAQRPEADALRVEIQRLLLASGQERPGASPRTGIVAR
jgi:tetratricopeptide (TPR) repeat protein